MRLNLNVRSFKVTGNLFTSQTIHYGFVDITKKKNVQANVSYNLFMISYECLKEDLTHVTSLKAEKDHL